MDLERNIAGCMKIQASTMKLPDFDYVLKIGKCFFPGTKSLLRTTGVQILH
jgi:hypothetical protein